MNQHILVAMDWKNRSQEELKKNRAAAAAAVAVADADAAVAVADAEYWINRYFNVTGEDREDYEKALKDMKK